MEEGAPNLHPPPEHVREYQGFPEKQNELENAAFPPTPASGGERSLRENRSSWVRVPCICVQGRGLTLPPALVSSGLNVAELLILSIKHHQGSRAGCADGVLRRM